jgi:hypothetical protein
MLKTGHTCIRIIVAVCLTTMTLTPVPAWASVSEKKLFSEKHPKIYQAWRKGRKVCIKLTPVVNFAGSCAQVVLLFI